MNRGHGGNHLRCLREVSGLLCTETEDWGQKIDVKDEEMRNDAKSKDRRTTQFSEWGRGLLTVLL